MELSPQYNAKEVEDKIYQLWEESGFFNPDNLPARHKEPFTIIMPPANANGNLHAGHALVMTIEDIITRYKRMQGFKALWLPGLDHAGFETQVVYEKKLEKEGRSRFGMDPEILISEIMDFTLNNKTFMEGQIRKLGASCDWSREKFTLDPEIIKIVYSTFALTNQLKVITM
ncbi:MAG: class I tRNA ligase family protein, partial [Candidatus Staskawiczbacteria bacterium]